MAASVTTFPAQAMLTAMTAGQTDPMQLAELAKGRMRRKIPERARA